jgi:hypothetical protein
MSPPTNNWRYGRTEHRFIRKSQWTSQHGTKNAKMHNRTAQIRYATRTSTKNRE